VYSAEDDIILHAEVLEKIRKAEASAAIRYAVEIGSD
jgi:hypothetical protein